ncbi:DsbA family protein [Streptomyces melanogenes]|uniref:DsbA family protein n=1 Tax=Streptomyces melanogenes TaxID=67326 RepID=UPI00167E95BD|nr:thioredoxin domain-containing protein [Streptomyces melanogenes]GGP41958.1 membrane protein [Streptomyces melanogenes]
MSEKNQEGKRTARERLAQERERQRSQDRRRRTMIVAAAVVCVLGLAAVIGVIAANTKSDGKKSTAGPLLAPTGAEGKDNLAIPVGAADAPSTLTVWEDFRCPACAMFENNFRTTLHDLENSGQIRVEYHLATLIDRNLGGSGSLHAANAAGCAQDAGKFLAYHDVLYGNQPKETDDAFAKNSRLIELAGKVPGLDTGAFRSCVEDGKHDSWVAKSNKAFEKAAFSGTPTVQLNGESIFPKRGDEEISPANLKKWVAEANKGKQPGTVPPSQPGAATPSAPSSPPAGAPAEDGAPKHGHAPGTAPKKAPAAVHPSKAVPAHEAP